MAEFDCINTYEQILALVKEGKIRDELFGILAEDKAHAEGLQKMLSERDLPKAAAKPELPDSEDYGYEY
jgi:rubrerythrin